MESETRDELEKSGLVEKFRALGDPTRLSVAARLAGAGPDGMCVTDLANSLEQDAPKISFHLTRLKYAGLVTDQRVGQRVIYRLRPDAVAELRGFLELGDCWK